MKSTTKPIIFSGPMVRAIIEGRKTQMRRVIELPTRGEYVRRDMGGWAASEVGGTGCYLDAERTIPAPLQPCVWNQTTGTTIVPPYAIGDQFWVRETWRPIGGGSSAECTGPDDIDFRASPADYCEDEFDTDHWDGMYRWHSPVSMFKVFSRITLTVTDVWVQRVQDMDGGDVEKEGFPGGPETPCAKSPDDIHCECWYDGDDCHHCGAIGNFRLLRDTWDSTNGDGAWERNDWVEAITFTTKETQNEN